jgi:hypothetical protein
MDSLLNRLVLRGVRQTGSARYVASASRLATQVVRPLVLAACTTVGCFLSASAYGEWLYHSSTDKMEGAQFRFARLASTDEVQMRFPYKNHKPDLILRTKSGRDLNILLEFSGQAQTSGIDGGQMRVKFDSGAPKTWSFSKPADRGRTGLIFINNERAFLDQMRKAKVVMIELPLFAQGNKVFGFDVTGLDVGQLGMKDAAKPPAGKKQ